MAWFFLRKNRSSANDFALYASREQHKKTLTRLAAHFWLDLSVCLSFNKLNFKYHVRDMLTLFLTGFAAGLVNYVYCCSNFFQRVSTNWKAVFKVLPESDITSRRKPIPERGNLNLPQNFSLIFQRQETTFMICFNLLRVLPSFLKFTFWVISLISSYTGHRYRCRNSNFTTLSWSKVFMVQKHDIVWVTKSHQK